ncbi:hypothetical protein GCM10010149_47890 [Nonomuraea roseoviolacea subsp. roseoviolacea]|uniref:hypothetical protein n=1 Tax=Nonomuraea roseoviolacea TaxID=103837 RepID=UPI0031DB0422
MSAIDSIAGSTGTLAKFIKNAVIADAIGVVELEGLPAEIDSLVSMAVDKWDEADNDGLDGMVVMILVMLSLAAARETEDKKLTNLADPNKHFPRF